MNNIERGKKLARAIFAHGDQPGDRVQRLQFMGGQYPDQETPLGGLCESALAQVIARVLEQLK